MKNAAFAAMLGALAVTGCASITAGTTQSVAVNTPSKDGAECKLSNEKGSWTIPKTPGATTVTKAYGDLTVACEHGDGSKGSASVTSSTAGAAFGNIIAGGIIGAAVDMGSGAAYVYPSSVSVVLAPPAGNVPTGGASQSSPLVVSPAAPLRLSKEDAESKLKDLTSLKKQKLITEAEYRDRSREILGQM
ncbi:hypothetical protein ACHMW5_13275 [Azospirillum melinis]|uniref:hypothetical protein n=1 Tax=Azospirillum melinis TaxID=328839 RepID=UPI003756A2C2